VSEPKGTYPLRRSINMGKWDVSPDYIALRMGVGVSPMYRGIVSDPHEAQVEPPTVEDLRKEASP